MDELGKVIKALQKLNQIFNTFLQGLDFWYLVVPGVAHDAAVVDRVVARLSVHVHPLRVLLAAE